MDLWGRFPIDENMRTKLKALWDSPDRAVLDELKDQMIDFLYGALRSCAKEDIDVVRAKMDAIETFFAFISNTAKEPEEVMADASPDGGYVSQTI